MQLEEKITELEKQLSKVQHEKESLADRLEEKALKGDYNPDTTKVLHFL